MRDNTNVFVTSDHGFSTVSRRDVDAAGRATRSYSATLRYMDADGRQEVNDGFLPPGFLAIDLARELDLPLFDPEQQTVDERGVRHYAKVDPSIAQPGRTAFASGRPAERRSSAGPGASACRSTRRSSLRRPPSMCRATIAVSCAASCGFSPTQDYVGGLFVNDRFGQVPGALRMSDVGLIGTRHDAEAGDRRQLQELSARSEKPAHERRSSSAECASTGKAITDRLRAPTRSTTWRPSAPTSRSGSSTQSPVSNADVQPTLAHLMKMKIPQLGDLRGRVITEALAGGPATMRFAPGVVALAAVIRTGIQPS